MKLSLTLAKIGMIGAFPLLAAAAIAWDMNETVGKCFFVAFCCCLGLMFQNFVVLTWTDF